MNGRDVCLYNKSNACSFGIAVGVIGFLFCLIFLVRDVLYVVLDFRNNILVSYLLLHSKCMVCVCVCVFVCTVCVSI